MEHMEHILEQNGAQNGTHGTQDAYLDTHVWTVMPGHSCLGRESGPRPLPRLVDSFTLQATCRTTGRLRRPRRIRKRRRPERHEFHARFTDVPTPKREHNIHTHYLHRSALTQLAPESIEMIDKVDHFVASIISWH